jgi:hypothetical protein
VSEVCGSVGDVYKGKIRNKNIRFRLEVKCEVELDASQFTLAGSMEAAPSKGSPGGKVGNCVVPWASPASVWSNLNGFIFCDDSLCEADDVEPVPVQAAGQTQRQRGLGVEEHPATLLPAGDVVDRDRVITHGLECSPRWTAA